jgi:hypothetical protein
MKMPANVVSYTEDADERPAPPVCRRNYPAVLREPVANDLKSPRRFIMTAFLNRFKAGVAGVLIVGSQVPVLGADPARMPVEDSVPITAAAARTQDFGPWSQEEAIRHRVKWVEAGYTATVIIGDRGWYVRVTFYN